MGILDNYASNPWYGAYWLQSKDDLKLKITLPQVTLITAMWWQTDYRSEYNAYIMKVKIDNIQVLPATIIGGKISLEIPMVMIVINSFIRKLDR